MKRLAGILAILAAASGDGFGRKFYDDDPLIQEPPPRPVENVKKRKLSDYYDIFWHTLATPGERHLKSKSIPAGGINTLGDPMEGAWWERRHYWRRLTLEELKRGPSTGPPPLTDAEWTVIEAKTEGITPGFTILDRNKRRFYIKFDPPSNPDMATGADQIASKLFYALGYHVPENHIVYFRPEMLVPGEEVAVADRFGRTHEMTGRDLTEILMRVHQEADGRYRATASLGLPGAPQGPYRYFGTRADDPNDTVPHEHRRDLRGMHLACAWLDHDDSRSINTLDILADGPEGKYFKHYQLDFGSTLGSGSDKVNSPRSGGEYLFDWKEASVQFVTLGLAVPRWARAHYPKIAAVGRFESAMFNPLRWVPEYPNPAFRNRLPDDEFWMAKQIVNIRDDEIRAVVDVADYRDRAAAEWITKCLIERRDKIGRAVFARVLPLDRFALRDGRLEWVDVAASSHLGAPLQIGVQWAVFDNERETSAILAGETSAKLPRMSADGYWLATLRSPSRPRQTVRVYVRKRGPSVDIVGVERSW